MIELIVVIAVLAVLALIMLPSVSNFITNARLSADQATVRTLNNTTALMRVSTTSSDPFLDETNDSLELLDVLIDNGYFSSIVTPLSSNAQFVWLFEKESWYLRFEDSFYEILLSDGFTLLDTGGLANRLQGSYSGTSKDIVIQAMINGVAIKEIGQDTFNNKGLVAIDFDDTTSLSRIHARAFYNNKLTSIEFPNSLTRIDGRSFMKNELTEINLPPNLKTIEFNAFDDNQLTKISIGSQVSNIGGRALGEHTEKFKSAYQLHGAGTYTWNGSNWVHE